MTFINLSEECSDCIWNLPDKGTFHAFGDQTVEFGEQGMYRAELVVENVYGCRDTAIMEHRVLIKGLYFPNTFIPHSQNPKINRFNGIGMGLARYRLQIFDQYGNKIWETRALKTVGLRKAGMAVTSRANECRRECISGGQKRSSGMPRSGPEIIMSREFLKRRRGRCCY